jgi:HTH-type transcriptional regulator, sugar sensing transcriptional regulator
MILDQYLQKIGLSSKEAKLYIAGLQLGPGSIQGLSNASNIKRSTVYEIMEDLVGKNLFTISQKGKRRIFTAQEPDNLMLFLKQQENVLEQIMPDLEAIKNTDTKKPAIRIYEGLDGLKQIYDDMIKKPGEISAMAAPKEKIARTLLDYLRSDWEKRRIKSKINLRRININNTGDESKTHQKIKVEGELEDIYYLPKDHYPFSVGIYTYRQKVAFVSYQEQEMVGIVLRSSEVNKTIKMMFEIFWGK